MHWFWRAAVGVFAWLGTLAMAYALTAILNSAPPGLSPVVNSPIYWIAGVIMPTLFTTALASSWVTHVESPDETRCRKCGYILRGITEPRCPECGERI